jgi:methionyl-tRNA synthetase
MDLAQFGNQYFDAVAPWALVRSDRERCGTVLHVSLEICKALAVLGSPFMPFSSERIWKDLGMEGSVESAGWDGVEMQLKEEGSMERPSPLFAKVDASTAGGFSQYAALDLKVGKVIDVQPHPNADKLYVMTVDIGRTITIVSGLKDFYTADELKTKTLIILTNLEPAKLRGVKSEGMLLAAEADGKLALLTPENDLAPGTQISSGLDVQSLQISYKTFQKLDMRVGLLAGGDPPKLEMGGKLVDCDGCGVDSGVKCAALVQDDTALVMHGPDGVRIVLDRDIPTGARIR